jgi:uncharacterized protein YneF (UPF0154 family)
MIPSSVAWFVLGFISCIILFIILGVYLSRKQEELLNKYVDNFVKNINDKKDDGDS